MTLKCARKPSARSVRSAGTPELHREAIAPGIASCRRETREPARSRKGAVPGRGAPRTQLGVRRGADCGGDAPSHMSLFFTLASRYVTAAGRATFKILNESKLRL